LRFMHPQFAIDFVDQPNAPSDAFKSQISSSSGDHKDSVSSSSPSSAFESFQLPGLTTATQVDEIPSSPSRSSLLAHNSHQQRACLRWFDLLTHAHHLLAADRCCRRGLVNGDRRYFCNT
jgi:hypothetical protein